MSGRKKISKSKLLSIIISAFVAVVVLSLIITNIFIPLKYLSAYTVKGIARAEEGTLRMHFLEVGYGDCTLIELPDGKTMLIDSGNGRRSNQLKILKLLNKLNIDNIDYLVAASVQEEDCGGFSDILKYKRASKIFMPYCLNNDITDGFRALKSRVINDGIETEYIEYGNGIFAEEYTFCFLSPSNHSLEDGEYDILNKSPSQTAMMNASAVCWLEYKNTGILLSGNITSEVAEKINKQYLIDALTIRDKPIDLSNCGILKVAGHGDKASVYTPLIDTLKPKVAVISVGANGRGCPSLQALADAHNYVKDELYRTDLDGTVTITLSDNGIITEKEKP